MDFKTETQLRQELAQAWALVDAYKEDSQRLQFLIDSRATVQYSQRDREGAPHVEVLGDQWCRRKTLREALDVLRSNALGEGRERGILREASSGEAATSTDGLEGNGRSDAG